MIEKVKEEKLKLEKTKEFLKFKRVYPKSYFYSAFSMYENMEDMAWQMNYYDPETEKITTFELNDGIKITINSKLFQKVKEKPKELDLDKVKINLKDAISIINKLRDDKYKDEHENKVIAILQNIENKQVWNITYITSELRLLNVRIDSNNGNIIHEKFESITRLKAK